MSRHRKSRSISLPITLSSIAVTLSVALLVGWTLLVVKSPALTHDIVANTVLVSTGAGALIVIMTVLVLFSIFLVREIREVRRQTSFIDSVTHELKSPLAALKLCIETLSREGLPEEQRVRLRGMMLDDVDRLSAFIDGILTANRLGEGAATQEIEEVAVAAMVRRAAAVIRRRSKIDESAVTVEIGEEVKVETDAVALATVVENLIDNAIKYSGEKAEVTVSARNVDESVVIEVRDHGIGIPRAALRRVFERFYRVPDEPVRRRRGTGLGLYVASELARNLGGRIEARSPGVGQGTTMIVTLPRRGGRGGRGRRRRAARQS
jgi:signal transduction histidine kinase